MIHNTPYQIALTGEPSVPQRTVVGEILGSKINIGVRKKRETFSLHSCRLKLGIKSEVKINVSY